jgi:TetR/AcrR family transcriptional regulator, mexJK operon transcriptional repressor
MSDAFSIEGSDRDPKAGRPKDPAKRSALVHAAQRLFMERGFESVSIDAIAQAAGVAKVTVYSHFPGKEALFAAAIREKCDAMVMASGLEGLSGGSVRARLLALAKEFFDLITDPDAMAIHRLVTAEGERVPEVAEIFFANAILNVCAKVAAALDMEVESGTLAIADTKLAAGHFLSLVKGMPMLRNELHLPPMPDDEFRQHLESAVDLFVRAHAPH